MAAGNPTQPLRHPAAGSVIHRLQQAPFQFDFFQAVRVLQWLGNPDDSQGESGTAVGQDHAPQSEVVRFQALRSNGFAQQTVHGLRRPPADGWRPAEMDVSFMGMTGPAGALPRHYTQLVIERSRYGDFALADFLDMFNHRFVSLFYRAWAKYRLPILMEQAHRAGATTDPCTQALLSFVGWGTAGLQGRQRIHDPTLLFYGGLFANRTRNANALERMMADYLSVAATIRQFQGQWMYLSHEDQSRLTERRWGEGWNNQLGTTAVVGDRVWGVENSFRLRLGPLNYQQFAGLTPQGDLLGEVAQLVRCYAGAEFDFDVQLVLRREDVPVAQLGGKQQSRLGWNTWIAAGRRTRDADDAVFRVEGWPDDRPQTSPPSPFVIGELT